MPSESYPALNQVQFTENLLALRQIPSCYVDLIYTDPPFNSQKEYNLQLVRGMSAQRAYSDAWNFTQTTEQEFQELTGGDRGLMPPMEQELADLLLHLRKRLRESEIAYLTIMASRMVEMRRVLRVTGSLFLHCDPTEDYRLRDLGEVIFGEENFLGHLIWQRTSSHNNVKRSMGRIHDSVLWLAKDRDNCVMNPTAEAGVDKDGEKKTVLSDLTAKGRRGGNSGKPWRGYDPSARVPPRHWQIADSVRLAYLKKTGTKLEGPYLEQLEKLCVADLVVYQEGGAPQYRRFVGESRVIIQDVWKDICPVKKVGEKLVFEGQKPEALVERIILTATNERNAEGGKSIVLDPFLGSGTTVVVAQRLGRDWIGIERDSNAVEMARQRVESEFGECHVCDDNPITIEGLKRLAEDRTDQLGYKIQQWVMRRLGGTCGPRGADGGVDGEFRMNGFSDNQIHKGIVAVTLQATCMDRMRTFRTTLRDRMGEDSTVGMGVYVAWASAIPLSIQQSGWEEKKYTSGIAGDTREFYRIQCVALEDLLYDKDWFSCPGRVLPPDLSNSPAVVRLREMNYLNEVRDLVVQLPSEEGPPW